MKRESIKVADVMRTDLEPVSATRTEALAQIERQIQELGCARLDVSLSPGRLLTLNGFVETKESLAYLRTRLLALDHVERVQDDLVQIQGWPFCQVMASLADAAAGKDSGTERVSILLNKNHPLYWEGEYFVVRATNNNPHEGYIYLDYVDLSGYVVHMLPTPEDADNRVAGWGEVVVGAEDKQSCTRRQCYEVSPPHGRSLVVAVWSPEPLYPRHHNQFIERAPDYFADLSTRIGNLKPSDQEKISVGYRFLETRK
jgi:hypothetical protein